MDQPLVSVIIPVYNAEQYISECVNSILSQTYKNIEIILCDDYSTDNSYRIIETFGSDKRIKVLRNNQNLHQAQTRNRCIRQAKGEYILLQDADDISKQNRIEKLLGAFENKIDFVGSECYCFDDDGKIHEILKQKEVYPTQKSLLWGIPHIHASLMIRKVCLSAIGGYRVTKYTKRGEDYDMVMRLYAAGFRGKNISGELYGYRVDSETIRRRDFRSRIDECVIRYEGFKANKILFPLGWVYIFKPIPAYLYQKMKYRWLHDK